MDPGPHVMLGSWDWGQIVLFQIPPQPHITSIIIVLNIILRLVRKQKECDLSWVTTLVIKVGAF